MGASAGVTAREVGALVKRLIVVAAWPGILGVGFVLLLTACGKGGEVLGPDW
jgi:hypothetical protein